MQVIHIIILNFYFYFNTFSKCTIIKTKTTTDHILKLSFYIYIVIGSVLIEIGTVFYWKISNKKDLLQFKKIEPKKALEICWECLSRLKRNSANFMSDIKGLTRLKFRGGIKILGGIHLQMSQFELLWNHMKASNRYIIIYFLL